MMRGSPAARDLPERVLAEFVFGILPNQPVREVERLDAELDPRALRSGTAARAPCRFASFPVPRCCCGPCCRGAKRGLRERGGVQEIQAVAIEVRILEDLLRTLIADAVSARSWPPRIVM